MTICRTPTNCANLYSHVIGGGLFMFCKRDGKKIELGHVNKFLETAPKKCGDRKPIKTV